MSGKVRIYELSKELGIDNKACLALCHELNIGDAAELKASSSLMAAQAERVRQRAKRDGLVDKTAEAADPAPKSGSSARARRAQRRPPTTRRPRRKAAQRTGRATAAKPDAAKPEADEPDAAEAAAPEAAPAKPKPKKAAPSKAASKKAKTAQPKPSDAKPDTEAAPSADPASAPTETALPADSEVAEPDAAADVEQPPDEAAAAATVAVPDSTPAPDSIQTPAQPQPDPPAEPDADGDASPSPTPESGTQQVISSHKAKTSRDVPLSASGKPIPPPPRGSTAITVDGEAFVPGVSRGRPSRGPNRNGEDAGLRRRRRPSSAATQVDAVFTPQKTRLPASSQGKGKTGKGSAGPIRTLPQHRRKGGRRRRRSVEDLRPIDQTQEDASLATAPVPQGTVEIPRHSSAQQIAPLLNRTAGDVVKYFMDNNEMIAAAKPLPDDLIELYAAEIGAEVKLVDLEQEHEAELQELLELPGGTDAATDADAAADTGAAAATADEADSAAQPSSVPTAPRPPIVTIMGHVDHGKTTLLDTLRETNVASGEAGGITQHIGAYCIEHNGQPITFIDTPGHEAFTAMRTRGANITDVVVLVVAADDGLMPQTEEAIDHAKNAEVPILVAINKMDKENINPDRVRQQLAEKELVPEAWGGDIIVEEISALQGDGLDTLLDSIQLQAEVQELTAATDQRAQGVVLESHKDIGRGPVATLLVLEGTLKVGDPVVAGSVWGRARALLDEHGQQVKAAGPSTPVQVLGLSEVAAAGDEFAVAPSQKVAEKVGQAREKRFRATDIGRDIGARSVGARLEDIFTSISAGETVTLNLVVKADTHGSMEALVSSLRNLERDNLKLAFVRQGVGGIAENDVQLAMASNAAIIGFNVRPDANSRQLASTEDIDIRLYEVIYQVTEDVEKALVGMLKPEIEERVTGEAEVREVFKIRRIGSVAGCFVNSGVITKGSQVRFLRDGTIIWRGSIKSLRRFQDDANEVESGLECGIGLSDFQDLKPGDTIETFEEHEVIPS